MTTTQKAPHIVLLGDSIFDNEKYVPDGKPVIEHIRQIVPVDWQATLLAVDGDVTSKVSDQTRRLPETATHLIVSVGGNDAITYLPTFHDSVSNIGEALQSLAKMRNDFCLQYRRMLNHVMGFNLPVAVCTIHTSIPDLGAGEKTALALFNEVILQEAFLANVPVIDLRLICNEEIDYSEVSPIEPSHAGGQKIAKAILTLLDTHDFTCNTITVISSLAPVKREFFSSSEQIIRRRASPVGMNIEVRLHNGYEAIIDVVEFSPGNFRRVDFDELGVGENGFLWGDEFEATKIGNGVYQFARVVEPAKTVHLQWNLGLFCYSGQANPTNKDWVALSLGIEDGYNLSGLRDYLISLDGALEVNDFFQCVTFVAHLPAKHEKEFLGALSKVSPELLKVRMEYIEADFTVEEPPYIRTSDSTIDERKI